jgi:probable rRNA maturation factor
LPDAPEIEIELTVADAGWSAIADPHGRIGQAVSAAVRLTGLPVRAGMELSVLLTSDDEVRALNEAYRGRNEPTNVLSFPQAAPQDGPQAGPAWPIGDIVLAWQTVAREARGEGRPVEHHFTHLAVHGLLHLFGYDHDTDPAAQRMEQMERRILASLGIPDPYGPDPDASGSPAMAAEQS